MPIIGSVVMPHPPIVIEAIGKAETKKAHKTVKAMHEACRFIARLKPDTIILSSPHSQGYQDYIQVFGSGRAKGNFAQFGNANLVLDVRYDEESMAMLEKAFNEADFPAGQANKKTTIDHGVSVPLVFLNEYYTDYQLIQVSLSNLPLSEHYRLGKLVQQALDGSPKRIVWLASGDLSHRLKDDGPYGFHKMGPVFDEKVVQALQKPCLGDLLSIDVDLADAAAECGLRSFVMMAGALDQKALETTFLSYEGPFGVGYAVAYYNVVGEDVRCDPLKAYHEDELAKLDEKRKNESALVKIARQSVEHYLKEGKKLVLSDSVIKEYQEPRAVFVSIKQHGQLRGCIGTLEPVRDHLAEEVLENALSAAFKDPRFNPVGKHELDTLSYSVDVLMPSEPIETLNGHDVKRYGLIASSKKRQGVLLPDLAGIDTAQQQLEIVLQKAGIHPDDDYQLFRFLVKRYT